MYHELRKRGTSASTLRSHPGCFGHQRLLPPPQRKPKGADRGPTGDALGWSASSAAFITAIAGSNIRYAQRSFLTVPSPHRIGTDVLAERLEQHAIEPKLAPIAELLDADGHRFVSRGGLWPIGAEQTVPPRQIGSRLFWTSTSVAAA